MRYSLVVISRNRPAFLARLLQYYVNCGLKAPILLGDASSGDASAEVREVVGAFRGRLDLSVTIYDPEVAVFERLRSEFAKVGTPLVAWVGDDDFLIPSALDEGAALLEARSDCAALIGKAISFTVEADGARGAIVGRGDYLQAPAAEERTTDRLLTQAVQGVAYCYSLRRTALAQRIMSHMDPDLWPDDVLGYYFFEMLDGYITAIDGRIVALDRLMMARQVYPTSSAGGWNAVSASRLLTDPRLAIAVERAAGVIAGELRAREPALSVTDVDAAADIAVASRVHGLMGKLLKRELATRSRPAGAIGAPRRALVGVRSRLGSLRATVSAAISRLGRRRDEWPVKDSSELNRIVDVIRNAT